MRDNSQLKKTFILLFLSSAVWVSGSPEPKPFPIPKQFVTLSADEKYLVNSFTNKPVFITGEDAYLLTLQASDSDVDAYLQDRASKGFNLVWVALIDVFDRDHPLKNLAGNVPFDGPDFTNFDPAYWAHIDFVVRRARARGITLAMGVAFVGSEGKFQASINKSSNAVLTAYGMFLGNRYKNFPNIIWLLGGDADPKFVNYSKINKIGAGIVAADPNHLMTLEAIRVANPPDQSTVVAYEGRPPAFININWAYNKMATAVEGCQSAYRTSLSSLPPLMGEDWYEREHSMTGFQTRQEGYWETLSGCYLGRMFGNGSIYGFNSPNGGLPSPPTWQSELDSVGSVGHQHQGELMSSRKHQLMIPDINHTVLTAGFGSGATLSVAARTSDGQTIIAYLSDGSATAKTIDMTKITTVTSTINAWWYNPRTGRATFINKFPNTGSRKFSAPDKNDWVLVLDDAAASLTEPGATINPGDKLTSDYSKH
jgi:Protein of unknown function (DUF4038)/Putative collagen-binding domain of a collagenase